MSDTCITPVESTSSLQSELSPNHIDTHSVSTILAKEPQLHHPSPLKESQIHTPSMLLHRDSPFPRDGPKDEISLKHTNSVSFNNLQKHEKSHRFSISSHPSSTNVPTALPAGIHPPSRSSTITGMRNPSITTSKLPALNTNVAATVVAPTTIFTPIASTAPTVASNTTPVFNSTSNSNSATSSRQNSNAGDFLQFMVSGQTHHLPKGGEILSPTLSSTVTSPVTVDSPGVNIPHFTLPALSGSGAMKKKITNKTIVSSPEGPPLPFTQYLQRKDDEKIHILLAATGSVATIKIPLIIDKLFKIYGLNKVSIQLVLTKPSEHFLKGLKIHNEVKIWRDQDEWAGNPKTSDMILHNELRKWADVMLIAPLSANTLSKMANGICDNLVTSIIRSWNPAKPILIAPAMNTFMYIHPMTKKHLKVLNEECPWIEILKPVEKVLVCGDIGMGGMREWIDIVEILRKRIVTIRQQKMDDNGYEEDDEEDDEDDEEEEDEDDDDDEGDDDDEEEDDEEQEEDEEKDKENGHQKKQLQTSDQDDDLIFSTDESIEPYAKK